MQEQSRILEIATGERQLPSGNQDALISLSHQLTSEDARKQASGFFNILRADIQVSDCSKLASANRIDEDALLFQLADQLRR